MTNIEHLGPSLVRLGRQRDRRRQQRDRCRGQRDRCRGQRDRCRGQRDRCHGSAIGAGGGPRRESWATICGMGDEVGRQPQYDVFADEFLEHAEDGFFNACYDRPACLALLGDVADRRVLDAACGPGLYAAELGAAGPRWLGSTTVPAWWRFAARGSARVTFACMTWLIRSAGCPTAVSTWRCARSRSSMSIIAWLLCANYAGCCGPAALWCSRGSI